MFWSLSSATKATCTDTRQDIKMNKEMMRLASKLVNTSDSADVSSLPVSATVLFCPSRHDPLPGSVLHNDPSLSADGPWTPTATTAKRIKNGIKTALVDDGSLALAYRPDDCAFLAAASLQAVTGPVG